MAKVIIKESFIDKHTNVVYEVGESIEMKSERIKEIQKTNPNFIEVVKESKKVGD